MNGLLLFCLTLGFVLVFVGVRLEGQAHAWLRLHVCGGLALASWYLADTSLHRYTGAVLYGAIAALAAWCLFRDRPRPGWWNGAHERIEPN